MTEKSKTFFAFLRGINVGGKNIIRMNDLKSLFESLEMQNVQTYLQSGNAIFNSISCDPDQLERNIETGIHTRYGFQVSVMVRDLEELANITEKNPFLENSDYDMEYFHLTLLSSQPDPGKVDSLKIPKENNETYVIRNREIYLYCPNGYGRTKLANNTFEKKLGVIATTRNWKTILAMRHLARI